MNLKQLSRALQSLDSQAAETVQAAVKEIAALKGENSLLTDALANYEQANAKLEKDNDDIHGLAAHYREAIRCPDSEDGQHEWDFEGQCNICEQWAREIIDAALEPKQ